MSLEEKELDKIMSLVKMDLVPVPDELGDRINKWVVSKKQSKKKSRVRNYLIVVAAVSILLLSPIVSPTAMTHAKDIPILGNAISWMEQFLAEYKGIKTAEENGYKPFKPHTFSVGNYEVKIDHLFLEDERLFFTLLVKGKDVADRAYEEQPGMYRMTEHPKINIESNNFEINPDVGAVATMGVRRISGEYYLLAKYKLYILPQTVQQFINNESKVLSFNVDIDGQRKANVEIPLSNSKIQLGKHYQQSGTINQMNKKEFFTIKKLVVYPTRMVLELSGGSEEEFLKMVSGKEKPYLKDEHGNIYSLRMLQVNPNAYKLESLSTIYFEEKVKKLTLHVNSEDAGIPINITKE
ncbi:hypothetical protein ACFSO7_23985 [Bacillus sp. CGMCC 1.16607]|uniref:hypothetical protein n=1 Tax=Bacillus sp. CGMCC 1.16607 TaxID=3351842 RepID=UPI0036369064